MLSDKFFEREISQQRNDMNFIGFRCKFARSTMVLFSRKTATPLAALVLTAPKDAGVLTMITARPETKSSLSSHFQGMLNLPGQVFQLSIVNLQPDMINFNVLHTPDYKVDCKDPGLQYGINMINELRGYQAYSIPCDQRTNKEMKLEGLTKKCAVTNQDVAVTVQEDEAKGAKKEGLDFFLSVVPSRTATDLIERFKEGTVWKSVSHFVYVDYDDSYFISRSRMSEPVVYRSLPSRRQPIPITTGPGMTGCLGMLRSLPARRSADGMVLQRHPGALISKGAAAVNTHSGVRVGSASPASASGSSGSSDAQFTSASPASVSGDVWSHNSEMEEYEELTGELESSDGSAESAPAPASSSIPLSHQPSQKKYKQRHEVLTSFVPHEDDKSFVPHECNETALETKVNQLTTHTQPQVIQSCSMSISTSSAASVASAAFHAPVNINQTQAGKLAYGAAVYESSHATEVEYAYEYPSEPVVLSLSVWPQMQFLPLPDFKSILEECIKDKIVNEGKDILASLNQIFQTEGQTCVIDLESTADTVLCMCGHKCLAQKNVDEYLKVKKSCPLCRQPIAATILESGLIVG
jgi:hypothetical protein